MKGLVRPVVLALLPLTVVVATATAGYVVVWRWSLLDALFMTVITVATVGYGEVRPLSASAQVFTIIVILAGVSAAAYAIGRIIDAVVEQQLLGNWKERRMNKAISALTGHTIVAGLGRVGSVVAQELATQGTDFVVVDSAADALELAAEHDWLCIQGDATEEELLKLAGVERAGSVIATLSTDAENLFVVVTARSLNPDVFIVARSSHRSSEAKLLKGGANRVLTPNVIGGRRMATMVLHPTVSDYLDLVSHGGGIEYRLQEIVVRSESPAEGRSIAEVRVRETYGAYILAIGHEGRIDANPDAQTVLRGGDHIVVLGTAEQVEALSRAV